MGWHGSVGTRKAGCVAHAYLCGLAHDDPVCEAKWDYRRKMGTLLLLGGGFAGSGFNVDRMIYWPMSVLNGVPESQAWHVTRPLYQIPKDGHEDIMGKEYLKVMDPNATQEWTSCEEEEFKALFTDLWNKKSCDRMEVLAKRFPAKSIQQLRDKHAEVFVDMLCDDIDGEPSGDDATSDWHDLYKVLEGGTHESVLGPLVETPLFEPSKQLLFKAAGDQEKMQKSHFKSSRKERQSWSAEEHRKFLEGIEHFGRGEWKSISKDFVPSRTPQQLASHAQKYFSRIEKNGLDDMRQRHSINDVRLVNHGMNITAHSRTEQGKGKGIASSIPPPILTEDTYILHFLEEGMPDFEQESNSPTNLGGQMTHNNHILESLQWDVSGTPSPIEQGSVLLHQTRVESGVRPCRKRSIGAATNRRNNKRILPGVLTSQTPQVVQFGQGSSNTINLSYEMVPIKRNNLHQNMPPF